MPTMLQSNKNGYNPTPAPTNSNTPVTPYLGQKEISKRTNISPFQPFPQQPKTSPLPSPMLPKPALPPLPQNGNGGINPNGMYNKPPQPIDGGQGSYLPQQPIQRPTPVIPPNMRQPLQQNQILDEQLLNRGNQLRMPQLPPMVGNRPRTIDYSLVDRQQM